MGGDHLFLPKLLIFIPPLHMSTQAPFYLLFMQPNRSIQQFNWSYSIWSKELYRFPTNSIILFSQQILSPQTKSTLILFLFWVRTNQLILNTHNFKTKKKRLKKKGLKFLQNKSSQIYLAKTLNWIKGGNLQSICVLDICFERFKRVLVRFSHGRLLSRKVIPIHQTEKL